jgi:hypothetical protein
MFISPHQPDALPEPHAPVLTTLFQLQPYVSIHSLQAAQDV